MSWEIFHRFHLHTRSALFALMAKSSKRISIVYARCLEGTPSTSVHTRSLLIRRQHFFHKVFRSQAHWRRTHSSTLPAVGRKSLRVECITQRNVLFEDANTSVVVIRKRKRKISTRKKWRDDEIFRTHVTIRNVALNVSRHNFSRRCADMLSHQILAHQKSTAEKKPQISGNGEDKQKTNCRTGKNTNKTFAPCRQFHSIGRIFIFLLSYSRLSHSFRTECVTQCTQIKWK